MTTIPVSAREFPESAHVFDLPAPEGRVRYSICTLVTKPAEYRRMLDSFLARGFALHDCEYLHVDNSKGNRADAYSSTNLFLRHARGEYLVLCHQDVELLDDGRDRLDEVIGELDRTDPGWALFGNAGAVRFGTVALRITDRYCENGTAHGPFPARCMSLDENFVVIRREANLALPRDRQGFHFYGTELCLIADMLGWNAYVVDFHLWHHGVGEKGSAFDVQKQQMIDRYRTLFRSRWVTTPSTDLFLSRSAVWNNVMNHHRTLALARRVARALHTWNSRRSS